MTKTQELENGTMLSGVNDKRTDVLYLSTYAHSGGQSIAANRIHSGLRAIGINSKMLALHSDGGSKEKHDEIHVAKPGKEEFWGPWNDEIFLKDYPNISQSHKISPAVAGVDICKYIEEFNPRIVQMHWINDGFVKMEDLPKINRKIVWRLADCWAFTGGCFYLTGCERYKTGCHNCPRLQSNKDEDMSYSVWQRKAEAFKNTDMTVVVPSMWMKELVKNSGLMKDKEVTVIPNGMDMNIYYPEDKMAARKELGIPLDKKVVLFGAGSPSDPRKGADLLRAAISKLGPKHRDEYYLVVFGGNHRPADFGIPMAYFRYIGDNKKLRLVYSAGDVMIVPSREESFGQTVTEAMACGTPVVTFLHTGPASAIDHQKTGYLANYCDIDDLASGIEWVLADDKRMKTLSENARQKVETTYDIKVVARQYQELYEHLLQEPVGRE